MRRTSLTETDLETIATVLRDRVFDLNNSAQQFPEHSALFEESARSFQALVDLIEAELEVADR